MWFYAHLLSCVLENISEDSITLELSYKRIKEGLDLISIYLGVLIESCMSVFLHEMEARFGKKALEKPAPTEMVARTYSTLLLPCKI